MARESCGFEYEATKNGNAKILRYKGSDEKVVIPASIEGLRVKEIAGVAFWKNSVIRSVELPSGLEILGINAFLDCCNLENINLPDTLTSIEVNPFIGCEKLTITISPLHPCFYVQSGILYKKDSNDMVLIIAKGQNDTVVIQQGTKRIGPSAFSQCTWLKSVIFPESLTVIEDHAFSSCESLLSPEFPEGLETIQGLAFSDCKSFTSVNLPGSLISLAATAFLGCHKLSFFEVSGENQAFSTRNGVLFNKDKTQMLSYPPMTDLESYTIPSGTQSIADYAFNECMLLKSLSLPKSLTKIGSRAFTDCKGLESIHLPEMLESIGESAFSGCEKLSVINLPESIKEIGDYCFSRLTRLQEVNVPGMISYLPSGLFSGCKNLQHLKLIEGPTGIRSYAFSNCVSLTSITFPSSIQYIGNDAFSGCTGLTTVTIARGMKSISGKAFADCGALSSIVFPDGDIFVAKNAIPKNRKLVLTVIKDSPMERWAIVNKYKYAYPDGSAVPPAQSADMIGNNVSERKSTGRKSQPEKDGTKAVKQTNFSQGTCIVVKDSWSIQIPGGYIYSTDPKVTGESYGGGPRQLVFMLDDGHTPPFDTPFDATENFSVIGKYFGTPSMPLDSETAETFKTQYDLVGESVVVIDTPSLFVSYVILDNTQAFSNYRITILTPRSISGAQAFFNRKGTLAQRRTKVLSWLESIRPVYDEHGRKIEKTGTEDETTKEPKKKSTKKRAKSSSSDFPTAIPEESAYWHYESLRNTQDRMNSLPGVTVNVNMSGTEFKGVRVPLSEKARQAVIAFLDDSESHLAGYSCHTTAGRLAEVFRVDVNAFDSNHDRESEIKNQLIYKAYMVSALRSFAWTLGNYAESKSAPLSDIPYQVLEDIGEFIKSRNWINFEQGSYFSSLCAGGDLHNLYVLDETDGFALRTEILESRVKTENSLIKLLNLNNYIPQMEYDAPDDNEAGLNSLSVQSLPALRKDLSALEPVMVTIHNHLERYRNRKQELTGPIADVLYAWCVFAVCAEYTFHTEDGPIANHFQHPEEQMIYIPGVGLIKEVDRDREEEIREERRATFSDTTVSIEGTGYENRNAHIEDVRVGDKLALKADYNNPYYKPVAVEVFDRKGRTLGYIRAPYAPTLKAIAGAISQITATVESVTPLSQRSSRAKYALMDISLKKNESTDDEPIILTQEQADGLKNVQNELEKVQSSLSAGLEVMKKHQEREDRLEREKEERRKKAVEGGVRRTPPKGDKAFSELYMVLRNEEFLEPFGKKHQDLYSIYDEDFPMYTQASFEKAIGELGRQMQSPERRRTYEEAFRSVEFQRRYELSTLSLFNLLEWPDFERGARQVLEWTRRFFTAVEIEQVWSKLQKDAEERRQGCFSAVEALNAQVSNFSQVKSSLRVSVMGISKLPDFQESNLLQQKVGALAVVVEMVSGESGIVSARIPDFFAGAWKVTPDDLWKEAIKNRISDQREDQTSDARRIAEQAREQAKRKYAGMLLPYERGEGGNAKQVPGATPQSRQPARVPVSPAASVQPTQVTDRLRRITSLKKEIAELNTELNSIRGWFKGRQKRELEERIEVKSRELEHLEERT